MSINELDITVTSESSIMQGGIYHHIRDHMITHATRDHMSTQDIT